MATRPRIPADLPPVTRRAGEHPNHYTPPGPLGNTQGKIVPDTQPNPGGESAPPIRPTEKEKSWWQRWGSELIHTGLDIIGLIPVAGELADGANALIYLAEGDTVNAAISAAAMVPGAGMAATGAKIGKKAAGAVAEGAAKKAEREAAEELAEKAQKEAAEKAEKEIAERKAKSNDGGKDKKTKKKMKCGEHGKYGDLKKKTGGGKFDRDHIPSKAALKKRAEALLGRELKDSEKKAIDAAGDAIAIPRQAHIDISPTYGQSSIDAAKDAADLAGSAKRDIEAMLEKIDEYDEDGGCKDAYKKASAEILKKTNVDYDKMLAKVLKGVKK